MEHLKISSTKRKSEAINLKGLSAAEAEIGKDGSQSTFLLEEVSTLARIIN